MDAFLSFAFLSLIFTVDETVDAASVQEGDHIYRWSCVFGLKYFKTHTHHAIVIKKTGNLPENILVLEFMRNSKNQTNLQMVTLEEFIKNGHHKTVHRVTYQDNLMVHWLKRNGCSSMETPLPAHKVVKRALKLFELNSTMKEPVERIYWFYFSTRLFQSPLDGEETPIDHGPWRLTTNNCECCVRWCKVGKWNSLQAAYGIHVICSSILSILVYMKTSQLVTSWFVGKTIIDAASFGLQIGICAFAGVSKEEIRNLMPNLIAQRICNFSATSLASILGSPAVIGAASSYLIFDAIRTQSRKTFSATKPVC
mmetsp:Transcript_1486/g.1967  ORF Transcript_1486/g.1967 Transcript_1486/m.1967 type:complete len:311 (+) Transcript_1486:66-998(+)